MECRGVIIEILRHLPGKSLISLAHAYRRVYLMVASGEIFYYIDQPDDYLISYIVAHYDEKRHIAADKAIELFRRKEVFIGDVALAYEANLTTIARIISDIASPIYRLICESIRYNNVILAQKYRGLAIKALQAEFSEDIYDEYLGPAAVDALKKGQIDVLEIFYPEVVCGDRIFQSLIGEDILSLKGQEWLIRLLSNFSRDEYYINAVANRLVINLCPSLISYFVSWAGLVCPTSTIIVSGRSDIIDEMDRRESSQSGLSLFMLIYYQSSPNDIMMCLERALLNNKAEFIRWWISRDGYKHISASMPMTAFNILGDEELYIDIVKNKPIFIKQEIIDGYENRPRKLDILAQAGLLDMKILFKVLASTKKMCPLFEKLIGQYWRELEQASLNLDYFSADSQASLPNEDEISGWTKRQKILFGPKTFYKAALQNRPDIIEACCANDVPSSMSPVKAEKGEWSIPANPVNYALSSNNLDLAMFMLDQGYKFSEIFSPDMTCSGQNKADLLYSYAIMHNNSEFTKTLCAKYGVGAAYRALPEIIKKDRIDLLRCIFGQFRPMPGLILVLAEKYCADDDTKHSIARWANARWQRSGPK